MEEILTLLAVTRMLSGFCLAGIDARGDWARPTKGFGALQLGDISYRDRALMQPFDRVRIDVRRRAPDPPHVEDRLCEWVRPRPERAGRLSAAERAAFLAEQAEASAVPVFAGQRSLILVRGEALTATFRRDAYSGKFEARLHVPAFDPERPLPVTDLRWRALGRRLLPAGGGAITLDDRALREQLGAGEIYLALGLGRHFAGRNWPLLVGVHPVPDYDIVVDPKNP